jgi:hypothetical protein
MRIRTLRFDVRNHLLPLSLLLCLFAAGQAHAAIKATVTKSKDLKLDELRIVAVVTTQCHEVMDCANLERRIADELSNIAGITFRTVPESAQREFLFSKGATEYTPELREALAVHFEVDAFMELSIPFAEKGDGPFGQRKSRVKVELRLTKLDGGILLHGVGTGRPLNVVTSPERVAGNVVEEILEEAFK